MERCQRILVVEPNREAGDAMASVLRTHACQALMATTAAEAQRVARLEAPDAVVASLELAGSSATDLIGLLRARVETASAPIIALSASAGAAQRLAGLRAGASDYLLAPVDGQELVARLATALGLRPEPSGLLLAVLGSKGGVGAGVVAANLAVALRHETRGRVLLVDAARHQGSIDVLLNLRPSGTAALLGRLDELELPDIERLLLQETDLGAEPEAVHSLLVMMRRLQCPLVVDCGSHIDEHAAAVAALADRVLLVLTPEIPALRGARRCLQWLDALGVATARRRLWLPFVRRGGHPAAVGRGAPRWQPVHEEC